MDHSCPVPWLRRQPVKSIPTSEKGFLSAHKTIAFEDFITYKGEQVRERSWENACRRVDYTVKDGDIMNFLFNV